LIEENSLLIFKDKAYEEFLHGIDENITDIVGN